jgi:cytidylate kinase
MAIITISRGSYSKGREVAERAAERLGYQVISRDLLLEASDQFHIPEIKLVRAIHDAPSILDRLTHGRQQYLAFIQSALADQAIHDNLVYHGLAGHLLLKGVPHVLKVRIIADLDSRVEAEMRREAISEAEARSLLVKDDNERRKWTQSLYGADPWDASLYDLVIHIHKLSVEDAADFLVHAAQRPCFQATKESQRKMNDLALACRIKSVLVQSEYIGVAVSCEFGNVVLYHKPGGMHSHHLDEKTRSHLESIPGVNHLEEHGDMPAPASAV